MLCGDLDIERAENDPAYIAQVRLFLVSVPGRRQPSPRSDERENRTFFDAERERARKLLSVLARPSALV